MNELIHLARCETAESLWQQLSAIYESDYGGPGAFYFRVQCAWGRYKSHKLECAQCKRIDKILEASLLADCKDPRIAG